MKKVVMLVLAVAMLFVGMVGVRAAETVTEADLVKKLKDTYTINGAKFTVSNDVKVLIDEYAANYDITDADAKKISDKVDDVIDLIERSGIKDMEDLGKIKSDLIAAFTYVVNETSIDGTYKDGKFIVYKPGTTDVFAEVDSLVKQTGTESNAIAILAGVSFVVMVAGAFVIVRKVRFN